MSARARLEPDCSSARNRPRSLAKMKKVSQGQVLSPRKKRPHGALGCKGTKALYKPFSDGKDTGLCRGGGRPAL